MSREMRSFAPSEAVLTEQSQLRIPSNLDWIEPTVEYLKTRAVLCGACEEVQAGRVLLALHEALTNSIVHGNLEVSSASKEEDHSLFARQLAERSANPGYVNRTVHIGIDYDGQCCRWALTDQGPGFDYQAILSRPEASDEESLWAVSGRGISLMQALVDELHYEAGGRRVILTLYRTNRGEKRQHSRWPMHQRVRVAPICPDGSVDWDAAYEAVTQNLSEGGLSLLQSQLNQVERVLIGLDIEGQTVYLPAQVRRCHAVEGNVLELGCRFLLQGAGPAEDEQPANMEEAIDGLLARLQSRPPVEGERRQSQHAVTPSGSRSSPARAVSR